MVHGANIRLSTMDLWLEIIKQKILDQSRALTILGSEGAELIADYAQLIIYENVDLIEARAAKEYFEFFTRD